MTRYVDSTEQLVTERFVHDVTRSTEFYRKLGFELLSDEGDFVELTWEGHLLFLAERPDIPAYPDSLHCNLRVMVPNVDDYWKLAGEMGARVIAPITDRDYGPRSF